MSGVSTRRLYYSAHVRMSTALTRGWARADGRGMSGVSITPEGRLEADLQTIERLKALCAEDAAVERRKAVARLIRQARALIRGEGKP